MSQGSDLYPFITIKALLIVISFHGTFHRPSTYTYLSSFEEVRARAARQAKQYPSIGIEDCFGVFNLCSL
jgi:hypothetical protein